MHELQLSTREFMLGSRIISMAPSTGVQMTWQECIMQAAWEPCTQASALP